MGLFLAVMTVLIGIWVLSGAGYFWPIWTLVGWGSFALGPGGPFGSCHRRRRRSVRDTA